MDVNAETQTDEINEVASLARGEVTPEILSYTEGKTRACIPLHIAHAVFIPVLGLDPLFRPRTSTLRLVPASLSPA